MNGRVSYFDLIVCRYMSNHIVLEHYSYRQDLNDPGFKQMISQLNQCPSGLMLGLPSFTYYSVRVYSRLLEELDNLGELRFNPLPFTGFAKFPSRLRKISLPVGFVSISTAKWLESYRAILEELAIPVSE
jgi:hypothetical protein